MARKDTLARGAYSAKYFNSGKVGEEVELKNLSSEPREEIAPIEIVKTRTVPNTVEPLGKQILVQRREPENFSPGGLLLIPIEAKERPAEGVILAKGEEANLVAVGDRVLFGKYAGTEYPFGDEILLFMREDEVIAKIKELK